MLPKDRKSYLAKLKGRDREFFMQRLVDTAPKTLNGIRSGLQGIEDALKHSFDILSAAPFRLDDPDEEAQRLIKLHGLLDATCAKSNKCAAIVTRNKKDFLDFGVTLMSPEELLKSN